MKRTDRLTTIIALLLFLALTAYMTVYLLRALDTATVTAQAVAAEADLSATASGIIIREETLLTSDEAYIDISAAEGVRVAAGTPIATAVKNEQGMERANRQHALEREISRVSAALQGLRSAEDIVSRDVSQTGAARELAAAVARHDPAALDAACLNLETLLLGTGAEDVSPAHLQELQQELDGLNRSTSADADRLTAPVAGVFSSSVDGYEGLSADSLAGLTPSGLQKLIEQGQTELTGAYGKLVRDYRWYYAAVMSSNDAANLSAGQTVTLNFGRYYSTDISARVMRVSDPEDGKVAVVFRCATALADTLSMRTAGAEVVFGSYSGIRIPAQAVRFDEEGTNAFVWTVTAMQLERKDIEIIYAYGDFVIAARDSRPGALRPGNTVVVSGQELYEGKLMG